MITISLYKTFTHSALRKRGWGFWVGATMALLPALAQAQTEVDAIMMNKNNFCTGIMYGHNSWKNYWEGTLKRDNANLGTVSSQAIMVMGNYGLKDNLNLLFAVPYISTKASAGTLAGMSGIQDGSIYLKWMPVEIKKGNQYFSVYGIAGASTPLTNYVKDYLPLSIGLGSSNFSGRLMLDYQKGNWFATASAAYFLRSKVQIDRAAYYTTQMHYTSTVQMPNALNLNLRAGWRSSTLIAEAVLDRFQSQGGFDISRNNMPFLSNQMNATRLGVNAKYTLTSIEGLSFIGNAMFTLEGRNMGQTTSWGAGIFYIIDFNRKQKSDDKK